MKIFFLSSLAEHVMSVFRASEAWDGTHAARLIEGFVLKDPMSGQFRYGTNPQPRRFDSSLVPAEHTRRGKIFSAKRGGIDSGRGAPEQGRYFSAAGLRSAAFTLIELLVVISIISFLTSVVLASLNSARNKGADTAVKAAMKQMHAQSQNYLDSAGLAVFGTAANCSTGLFADARFAQMITNAQNNSGSTAVCGSLGANWAVSVPTLKGGGSWCTDNNQGWFRAGTAQTSGTLQGMCQ